MNVKRFFKRNSSTILTCIGAAGVIATSVMAVKATPKALYLLEVKEEEKGEKLTVLETIQTAGMTYAPSEIMGIATIGCIFGASVLNKRAQASLMSAYALLDSSYKDYKKKVGEVFGSDAHEKVVAAIAKDKYEDQQVDLGEGRLLYYDFYSGRYFQARPYDISHAEYEINKRIVKEGAVYLNEWYDLIGLDPVPHGFDMGWTSQMICDFTYDTTWLDFYNELITVDEGNGEYEGLECIIISFGVEPQLDFLDY